MFTLHQQIKYFWTLACICLVFSAHVMAQDKYRTNSGNIEFNASTPLEDIYAKNDKVNAILESGSGKFAVVMLVKEFRFKKKLMEEHFNENYLESDLYPKAYFSGAIEDLDLSEMGPVPLALNIEGQINIHDVSRPLKTTVTLSKDENRIFLESNFIIRPEDHNIEVPKIVFKKIAQEVEVSVKLELLTVEYSK